MIAEIRHEEPEDYGGVREIHQLAFGQDGEANLVELLRGRKKSLISLVALFQRRIVGHIMFSPVSIAVVPPDFRGVGLGPLAVHPEFQNRGIGSQLTEAGLHACRQQGYDAVVVLGHPSYYPRFGFSRAKDFGLDNEYHAHDEFMVLELTPDALRGAHGLVKYAPEFGEVGV